MAILNNESDLTHIVRTTSQWENTVDKYEIIPLGVLCVEFTPMNKTNIKIGDGHKIFRDLPYIAGTNLSDYYTKTETIEKINQTLIDSNVVKIKGKVGSVSDLPLSGNNCGDVWFVTKSEPVSSNMYDEYIWFENKWEHLGTIGDIDLSEYAKKKDLENLENRIDSYVREGYIHKHDNKEILDQTDAVFNKAKDDKLASLENYDDTEIRKLIHDTGHVHDNKEILDQIDAVYNKAKDEKLNSLHNYDDTKLSERVQELENVKHYHDNKDILDRVTAAFTKEQAIQLLDCKDFTGATNLHDGYHGFVPAPSIADREKFLRGDGRWVEVSGGGDSQDYREGHAIKFTRKTEHGIPEGYIELSYIENTSDSYIKTDYIPKENTKVICVTSTTDTENDKVLFGVSQSSSSGNFVLYAGNSEGTGGFLYGSNSWTEDLNEGYDISSYISGGTITEFQCSIQNGLYINNTLIHTLENKGTPAEYNMGIFTMITGTEPSDLRRYFGKLYSFEIYESNKLIHKFLPAYCVEDEIAGLYDVINEKFYSSESTDFDYDPDDLLNPDELKTFINVNPGLGLKINYVDNELDVNLNEFTYNCIPDNE